uniref:Uncharacterized protein n=1 Tax=Panagrolaimus sp. ES5 TaxID=591445 RepID=A0AC34F2T0_9BILA
MPPKRRSGDSLEDEDYTAEEISPKRARSYAKYAEIIGIPKRKLKKYKQIRKIKEFYPWQIEYLNDQRLINGMNSFLTAETGGGKTLVAEVLILRTMITRNCSAILALPLIALVDEKVPVFKALAEVFGIQVEEYAGDIRKFPVPKPDKTLYICSYELARIICIHLKEAEQFQDIGLLVLDEIHMVDERKRGENVEMLVSEYRAATDGQVVAMSATVGNIGQLTNFVGGFHYHSSFRPVPLQQFIVSNGMVMRVEGDKLVNEKMLNFCWFKELAFEIVPQHSVILFCNTRNACEITCSFLRRHVPSVMEMHRSEERQAFVDKLIVECKKEGKVLPDNLRSGLSVGISYHHAFLSPSQRRAVEQGFRSGLISIICATTTLAVGINLPVRRVIIKSAKVGVHIMDKGRYSQMSGRAGRAGLDDMGECFIFADENYSRVTDMVLRDEIPDCVSRLKLEHFIFDFVRNGHNTEDKLSNAINKTLFSEQNLQAEVDMNQTIIDLKEPKFLLENSQNELVLSPLTQAANILKINPRKILPLIEHFSSFNNSYFSIIAYYIPKRKHIECNPSVFCCEYLKLDSVDKQLLESISAEDILVYLTTNVVPSKLKNCYSFYASLMINRLLKGKLDDSKCAKMFYTTPDVLHEICKDVVSKFKRLKRAAFCCDEMTALRKPVTELIDVLKKYCKKL